MLITLSLMALEILVLRPLSRVQFFVSENGSLLKLFWGYTFPFLSLVPCFLPVYYVWDKICFDFEVGSLYCVAISIGDQFGRIPFYGTRKRTPLDGHCLFIFSQWRTAWSSLWEFQ